MIFDFDINDKKEVFKYLSMPGNNVNGRLTREDGFSKNFKYLYKLYKEYNTGNEIDDMPFIQKLWYFLQDIYEPIKCKYCSKITPFNGFKYGHQKYCCISCMNKDEEHKNNVNKGLINNFGSFEEYIRIRNEKSIKTCIEKYNVKNAGGYSEYVEKGKNTKIQKYGSLENLYKLNDKKTKETLIKKYGSLEDAYKNMTQKRNESNIKNHDGILYAQTDYAKKNISKKVKEKNRSTFINKVLNNDINVINIYNDNILLCKCYECDCDLCEEKMFEIPYHIYIDRKNKNLPICYKKYNRRRIFAKTVSKNEKELLEYIKSIYNGVILENDRCVLDGKEIDIYLPELKIGFEYNGDFWHCNPMLYDSNYINPISHKTLQDIQEYDNNKIKNAKIKGVSLYIIWEHDWEFNSEIKTYIYNIINNKNE